MARRRCSTHDGGDRLHLGVEHREGGGPPPDFRVLIVGADPGTAGGECLLLGQLGFDCRAACEIPAALEELSLELSKKRWKDRRAPPGQLQRLASLSGGTQPEPWAAAALLLLRALRIEV